jgi:uncharacterized protein (DUF2062 family)
VPEPAPADAPASAPAIPPPRKWWQRRIVDPIVAQLTQGLTPHKIALTIAIGSAIAMFPVLGTTALLCLLIGIFMRLNQPIIQAVNLACAPIHIPFIYYSFIWGRRLFGDTQTRFDFRHMMRLLRENPWQFLQDYDQTVYHAMFIWLVLAPFWALAIYYIALPILRGIEKVRVETSAKAAAEKARSHPVP